MRSAQSPSPKQKKFLIVVSCFGALAIVFAYGQRSTPRLTELNQSSRQYAPPNPPQFEQSPSLVLSFQQPQNELNDPRLAAEPLENQLDRRCGGGYDPSKVALCGFDSMRARAKAKGDGPNCMLAFRDYVCQESPWKNLDMETRARRILKLAEQYAPAFNVDPLAIPCFSVNESIVLDPMVMAYPSCTSDADDSGLEQIVYPTLLDLVQNGFVSQVPPFDKPPYTTDSRLLFSAMATSAALQVELMAAVYGDKLEEQHGHILRAMEEYNGGPGKVEYGKGVKRCYDCMLSRQKMKKRPSIISCLDRTDRGAEFRDQDLKRICASKNEVLPTGN
jgi:hypothetical protein